MECAHYRKDEVREEKLQDQRVIAEWDKEQESTEGKQNKVREKHRRANHFNPQ